MMFNTTSGLIKSTMDDYHKIENDTIFYNDSTILLDSIDTIDEMIISQDSDFILQ